MLPSLRLWRLLYRPPVSAEFRRLLRLDKLSQSASWRNSLPALFALMVIPGVGLTMTLFINLLCLQKARQIATAISKHTTAGRYDVLAITPAANEGLALEIGRGYCFALTYRLRTLVKIWLGVTVGVALLFAVLGSSAPDVLRVAAAVGVLTATMFTDYVQCVVGALAVGILAGVVGQEARANVFAFALYTGFQVIFYLAFGAAIITAAVWTRGNVTPLGFGLVLLLFLIIREGAILFTWQKIRGYINEDLPALI
ncbi:MAG: hypothetical protein U0694_08830 [Anaerolineae bacterium]